MTALIEFEHYRYRYPDGTPALNDLSFRIQKGEQVGIVGPNGAGKTTALLALSGLLFGEGAIRIEGETLERRNGKHFRQSVGLVFQNPDDQLFMPTVYEDVAFGPQNLGWDKGRVDEAVKAALQAVELEGYQEKSSHHLSSGEKKRVAIATVLSMQPRVLILDEPSTNLDPHARRQLINLIESMDITTIIAGHDLELILELCDRALIMAGGRAVGDGSPRSLFRDRFLMEKHLLEVPYSLRSRTEQAY